MQESTAKRVPDKELRFNSDAGGREDGEPTASELEQVARLLGGDSDGKAAQRENADNEQHEPDEDGGERENASDAPPTTLEAVAEKLGVSVADLYALEIGQPGDGEEKITLGQLKDMAQEKGSFKVEQLEWEEKRAAREAELVKSMSELQDLVAMLPKSAISQNLLQAVASKRAATLEAEALATVRAIPSWSNDDAKASDLRAMNKHLERYGFPANYAEQIVDHRTLFFIRESMLREQRIAKALEQVSTVRKPGHATKPSSSSKPPRKQQPAQHRGRGNVRNRGNEVAQVLQILNEG